jgi:hypothetical protein
VIQPHKHKPTSTEAEPGVFRHPSLKQVKSHKDFTQDTSNYILTFPHVALMHIISSNIEEKTTRKLSSKTATMTILHLEAVVLVVLLAVVVGYEEKGKT